MKKYKCLRKFRSRSPHHTPQTLSTQQLLTNTHTSNTFNLTTLYKLFSRKLAKMPVYRQKVEVEVKLKYSREVIATQEARDRGLIEPSTSASRRALPSSAGHSYSSSHNMTSSRTGASYTEQSYGTSGTKYNTRTVQPEYETAGGQTTIRPSGPGGRLALPAPSTSRTRATGGATTQLTDKSHVQEFLGTPPGTSIASRSANTSRHGSSTSRTTSHGGSTTRGGSHTTQLADQTHVQEFLGTPPGTSIASRSANTSSRHGSSTTRGSSHTTQVASSTSTRRGRDGKTTMGKSPLSRIYELDD